MKKRLSRIALTIVLFLFMGWLAYNAPEIVAPKNTKEQVELGEDLDKILEGFKND
jgi:hypothetical protein